LGADFRLREAAKKSYFFWWLGFLEGGRAWPLRKNNFFEALKKIPPKNVATKLERVGE